MICDLAGCGHCLGAVYRLRGGAIVRCARHIRLQELWASSIEVARHMNFKEWENGASVTTLAQAMNVNIDPRYWEEVNGLS